MVAGRVPRSAVTADLPRDFLNHLMADTVTKRRGAAGPSLALTAVDTAQGWQITGVGEPVEVAAP